MLESGAFSVRGDSRPLCHSTSWSSPFFEGGGVEAILEVINGFFIFLVLGMVVSSYGQARQYGSWLVFEWPQGLRFLEKLSPAPLEFTAVQKRCFAAAGVHTHVVQTNSLR